MPRLEIPRLVDAVRLAAVHSTGLLDTPQEPQFDRLTSLASALLETPLAFMTLVDDRRSFWKSCIGVNDGTRENTVEESFCQYIVATGSPLLVDDATTDPRTRDNPSVASMGIGAWAGHPLLHPDGSVLGSFCVVDLVPRRWTDRDVEVLAVLAGAASSEIALRLARSDMADAGHNAAYRQELLRAAARATLDAVLVLDADGTVVSLNARFVEIWALPAHLGVGCRSEPMLAHLGGLLDDPNRLVPRTGGAGETVRDELRLVDGRVLDRSSTDLRGPDGALYGFAWYLRDVTLERLTAAFARRLQAATARLAEVRTVAEVTRVVLEEGTEALGATTSGLALLDGDALHFTRHAGQTDPVPSDWLVVPLTTASLITHTWHQGTSVFLPDPAAAESLIARAGMTPLPAGLGEQAWATALLRASGAKLGVLRLAWDRPHGLGDLERSFLQTLADQCAQAIERVRLGDARDRAVRRARVRARVSDRLSASLDLHETLATTVELFVPEIADWCAVHLLRDDGRIDMVRLQHRDAELQRHLTALFETVVVTVEQPYGAGYVIRTGVRQHLPTITPQMLATVASSPEQAAALAQLDMTAGIVLPLTARSRVLGALSVVRDSGEAFSDDELQLAGDVAARAALAVDNARLYAEQRDVALTLQRSLLPAHLPTLPGVRLGRRYFPGGSGAEVGGDLYDALSLPGGLVSIAVADVQGHGVRAAAVMGQLRAALRGYALEGHSPVGVIGRADTLMQALEEATYATAVYAQVDPVTGAVELAGAGHPGPLLLTADGTASFIDLVPGAPLGVGGVPFGAVSLLLAPGDTLLLYTDGLVEGRRQPIEDGMATLAKGLTGTSYADPDALCDAALDIMARGPHHDDDIALLALTFDGTSQASHSPH